MILVVDEYAKELTNARTFAAVEVVGNPKYDHYRDLDTVTLRARFWEKYNLNKENAIIGFIGQPLNQFIGYANTLKKCSEIISEMGANLRCFYRPHPKEDANTQHQIVRFFERSGCELTLHDCDSPIEELFAGSDLLVTFSTAGYDAQMLNAFSDIALASTLYLKTDDSINDFYKNQNTMNEIPYSMPPFALTVSKQDDLASTFKQSLAPELKSHVISASRRP